MAAINTKIALHYWENLLDVYSMPVIVVLKDFMDVKFCIDRNC